VNPKHLITAVVIGLAAFWAGYGMDIRDLPATTAALDAGVEAIVAALVAAAVAWIGARTGDTTPPGEAAPPP